MNNAITVMAVGRPEFTIDVPSSPGLPQGRMLYQFHSDVEFTVTLDKAVEENYDKDFLTFAPPRVLGIIAVHSAASGKLDLLVEDGDTWTTPSEDPL